MTALSVLDLSEVSIAEYQGADGTFPMDVLNPANVIPQMAFFNISNMNGSLTLTSVISFLAMTTKQPQKGRMISFASLLDLRLCIGANVYFLCISPLPALGVGSACVAGKTKAPAFACKAGTLLLTRRSDDTTPSEGVCVTPIHHS